MGHTDHTFASEESRKLINLNNLNLTEHCEISSGALKIIYFAVQTRNYPRNRLIRARLEALGHHVDVVDAPVVGNYLSRVRTLAKSARRIQQQTGPVDLIILAEFAAQYTPIAALIAREQRAVLIHDYFVGLAETNIEDWGKISPRSPKALAHRLLDRLAVVLPDLVVSDTSPRADSIQRRTLKPVLMLPVEAPTWTEASTPLEPRTSGRVLFYGNYIPLHGVETIATALSNSLAEVRLIGAGAEKQVLETRFTNSSLHFLPPISETELAEEIMNASVVLGIFGTSTKAATVIPNKVWQALRCGKIVVTRESAAYSELVRLLPTGQLFLVPPSDPAELRRTVEAIIRATPKGRIFPETASIIDKYYSLQWANLTKEIASRFFPSSSS